VYAKIEAEALAERRNEEEQKHELQSGWKRREQQRLEQMEEEAALVTLRISSDAAAAGVEGAGAAAAARAAGVALVEMATSDVRKYAVGQRLFGKGRGEQEGWFIIETQSTPKPGAPNAGLLVLSAAMWFAPGSRPGSPEPRGCEGAGGSGGGSDAAGGGGGGGGSGVAKLAAAAAAVTAANALAAAPAKLGLLGKFGFGKSKAAAAAAEAAAAQSAAQSALTAAAAAAAAAGADKSDAAEAAGAAEAPAAEVQLAAEALRLAAEAAEAEAEAGRGRAERQYLPEGAGSFAAAAAVAAAAAKAIAAEGAAEGEQMTTTAFTLRRVTTTTMAEAGVAGDGGNAPGSPGSLDNAGGRHRHASSTFLGDGTVRSNRARFESEFSQEMSAGAAQDCLESHLLVEERGKLQELVAGLRLEQVRLRRVAEGKRVPPAELLALLDSNQREATDRAAEASAAEGNSRTDMRAAFRGGIVEEDEGEGVEAQFDDESGAPLNAAARALRGEQVASGVVGWRTVFTERALLAITATPEARQQMLQQCARLQVLHARAVWRARAHKGRLRRSLRRAQHGATRALAQQRTLPLLSQQGVARVREGKRRAREAARRAAREAGSARGQNLTSEGEGGAGGAGAGDWTSSGDMAAAAAAAAAGAATTAANTQANKAGGAAAEGDEGYDSEGALSDGDTVLTIMMEDPAADEELVAMGAKTVADEEWDTLLQQLRQIQTNITEQQRRMQMAAAAAMEAKRKGGGGVGEGGEGPAAGDGAGAAPQPGLWLLRAAPDEERDDEGGAAADNGAPPAPGVVALVARRWQAEADVSTAHEAQDSDTPAAAAAMEQLQGLVEAATRGLSLTHADALRQAEEDDRRAARAVRFSCDDFSLQHDGADVAAELAAAQAKARADEKLAETQARESGELSAEAAAEVAAEARMVELRQARSALPADVLAVADADAVRTARLGAVMGAWVAADRAVEAAEAAEWAAAVAAERAALGSWRAARARCTDRVQEALRDVADEQRELQSSANALVSAGTRQLEMHTTAGRELQELLEDSVRGMTTRLQRLGGGAVLENLQRLEQEGADEKAEKKAAKEAGKAAEKAGRQQAGEAAKKATGKGSASKTALALARARGTASAAGSSAEIYVMATSDVTKVGRTHASVPSQHGL
jgi:hypothetical protein